MAFLQAVARGVPISRDSGVVGDVIEPTDIFIISSNAFDCLLSFISEMTHYVSSLLTN